MLQLRDACLKYILAIKPKGPEACGALLSNASERKSWPPWHQQGFLQHLAFLMEIIHPNSDLMQPCITLEPVRCMYVQMLGFPFRKEFDVVNKFCTPGTLHPTAATASTFIKLS